jgi:hypothetical protein
MIAGYCTLSGVSHGQFATSVSPSVIALVRPLSSDYIRSTAPCEGKTPGSATSSERSVARNAVTGGLVHGLPGAAIAIIISHASGSPAPALARDTLGGERRGEQKLHWALPRQSTRRQPWESHERTGTPQTTHGARHTVALSKTASSAAGCRLAPNR